MCPPPAKITVASLIVGFSLLACSFPLERVEPLDVRPVFNSTSTEGNSSHLLDVGKALSKELLLATNPSWDTLQVKSSSSLASVLPHQSSQAEKIASALSSLLAAPLQQPPPISSSAVGTGAPGIPMAMVGIGQTPFAQRRPTSDLPPDAIFSVASGENPGLNVAVLTQVPGQVNGKGGPKSGAPGTLLGPPLNKNPTTTNLLLPPNIPKNLRAVKKRHPPQNNDFQSHLYNAVRRIQRIRPPNPYLALLPTPPTESHQDPFNYVETVAEAVAASPEEARKLLEAARKLVPGVNLFVANSANSGNSPGNNGNPKTAGFRRLTKRDKLRLLGIGGPTPDNPNGPSPAAPAIQFLADVIPPSLPKATFLFNFYQPGVNLIATPSAVEWILEEILDFKFTAQLLGTTSYYDLEGAG